MFGIRKKKEKKVDIPGNTLITSGGSRQILVNPKPLQPPPKPVKRTVKKVRKRVCTKVCRWCDGTGMTMGSWHLSQCNMCKGRGGDYEYQMVTDSIIEEEIV